MRYTIRELKLGEILDQAVNLTKDHFGVLLGITGVLMIPFYVLGGLIQVSMIPKLPPNPTPEQAAAVTFGAMRVSLPFGLLGAYVITPITNGCNYWVGVTQLSVFCRRAVGLPASRGSSRRHSTRH